jgi:hexosaminidase
MLNTTWNDDGETLFGMTWPGLVFGAECSWGEGESSIEKFKAKYDWAFYRNEDHTFQNAIDSLDKTHEILRGAKLRQAQDEYDWTDPFTPSGADFYQRMLPLTHDIRISAEHALELLYSSRNKAQLHADTLEPMIFAGMRLDELGMKVQMYSEANNYYWDAYQNPTEQRRVNSDLSEIVGINARLMDMRDQTELLRAAYQDLWLKENRPYWLGNVLLRYDATALRIQNKIWEVGAARRQLRTTKQLPAPEQLGFYMKPPATTPAAPTQQPAAAQQPTGPK